MMEIPDHNCKGSVMMWPKNLGFVALFLAISLGSGLGVQVAAQDGPKSEGGRW